MEQKRGRKPAPAESTINIRMRVDEKLRYSAYATSKGMPVSTLFRHCVDMRIAEEGWTMPDNDEWRLVAPTQPEKVTIPDELRKRSAINQMLLQSFAEVVQGKEHNERLKAIAEEMKQGHTMEAAWLNEVCTAEAVLSAAVGVLAQLGLIDNDTNSNSGLFEQKYLLDLNLARADRQIKKEAEARATQERKAQEQAKQEPMRAKYKEPRQYQTSIDLYGNRD